MLKQLAHLRWIVVVALLALVIPSVFATSDTFTGTFTTTSEYFTVDIYMQTGWQVELTMLCAPTTEIDPFIWVFDSQGSYVWATDDSYTACTWFASSRGTFTAPATGWYTVYFGQAVSSAPGPYEASMNGQYLYSEPANVFEDGRINNKDAGPVVVYGDGAGGLNLYLPNGTFMMNVSAAEFAAVGVPSDENAFVAMDESLGLYVLRLTSGQYQVNMFMPEGKTYTFIFDAPYAGAPYTSFESE